MCNIIVLLNKCFVVILALKEMPFKTSFERNIELNNLRSEYDAKIKLLNDKYISLKHEYDNVLKYKKNYEEWVDIRKKTNECIRI